MAMRTVFSAARRVATVATAQPVRSAVQRGAANAWGYGGAAAAAAMLFGASSVGMMAGENETPPPSSSVAGVPPRAPLVVDARPAATKATKVAATDAADAPAQGTPSLSSASTVTTWKAYKDTMKIFSGNANPQLARDIAELLGRRLGRMKVGRFADGEVNVQVYETVRGKDIYIVQPTCKPVNEHLMELFLMVSTMRRASARKITCVIPYYGYARQDRKMTARVPISAADVARLLESMGADRVVAVDLHCGQIQGFFGPRVPVDNLDAGVIGVKYFAEKQDLHDPVVVSPDAGGVYRAKKFGEGLKKYSKHDPNLAMIIKQRRKAGEVASMDLVGSVDGSDVIIVDDMIDTAGTLCKAAAELKKHGARRVFAFASHGLFSGPAVERIKNSVLEEVITVNTVPLPPHASSAPQLRQLSVAPLIADTIDRIHNKKSVSELFRGANN